MKIITAPNELVVDPKDVLCYLGGDITGRCWQDEVINALMEIEKVNPHEHLVIINPRGENVSDDMSDYAKSEQETWQFHMVDKCDIFSMYFPNGKDQAIYMYELGRGLVCMKHKFPISYHEQLVISTERDYVYRHDVIMQTSMAVGRNIVTDMATPRKHAREIIMAYTWFTEDL